MTGDVARRAVLGGVAALLPLRHVGADPTWSSRPVRLLVPFGAGGAVDTLSRAFAQRFPEHANGQAMPVENRAGAGGTIAAAAVATARPDGYTLLMGDMGPDTAAAEVMRGVPYDPMAAFTPILHIANLRRPSGQGGPARAGLARPHRPGSLASARPDRFLRGRRQHQPTSRRSCCSARPASGWCTCPTAAARN